jgi:hypothetical protein
MYVLRRCCIAILFVVITWFAVVNLKRHLDPNTHISDEEREDARWIATSKHFLDRNACRYIGICGIAHYHWDPATRPKRRHDKKSQEALTDTEEDAAAAGWGDAPDEGGRLHPEDFDGDERVLKEVPQFVLDHAPLIHLYSGEEFWPSDIVEHLTHTSPHRNYTSLHMNNSQHTVHNLHELNDQKAGKFMFMKSKDDVEERPGWLGSSYNKPVPYEDPDEEEVDEYTEFVDMDPNEEKVVDWWDPFPKAATPPEAKTKSPLSFFRAPSNRPELKTRRSKSKRQPPPLLNKPSPSGRSPAPAILILIDKGHGILDAFWFYFYSYNLGTTVLTMRFGNHIGDWEHSLIRFHNGEPKAVFFSAHSGGTAFSYNSVEKGKGEGREGRPVLYSALGSHAMYAMPGTHPYVLPWGLLADVTDKGPLWDPVLNYLAYHYNTSITHNADAQLIPSPSGLTTSPDTPDNPSTFPAIARSPPDAPSPAEERYLPDTFVPAANNPDAPTSWFWYRGHWGDKFYDLGDWRQWRFVGQYHYVNGPLGPRFKNLGRSHVCQSGWGCRILDSIEGRSGKSWIKRKREVEVVEA